MPFLERYDFIENSSFPKGRIYQHSGGYDLFKGMNVKRLLNEAFLFPNSPTDYDFVIGIARGDEKRGRIFDFESYPKGIKENWRTALNVLRIV